MCIRDRSTPAMSTPATPSVNVHSFNVHPCRFLHQCPLLQCPPLQFSPSMSTPAISVNPLSSPRVRQPWPHQRHHHNVRLSSHRRHGQDKTIFSCPSRRYELNWRQDKTVFSSPQLLETEQLCRVPHFETGQNMMSFEIFLSCLQQLVLSVSAV